MKKKDIWISIAIIAAAVLVIYFYPRQEGYRQEGYMRIDTPGAELQLRGSWFHEATITSGPEPTAVSAGVHRPNRLSISSRQGSPAWRLDSTGPWGNLSRINVKDNETAVIELGPPLLIKPTVRRSGSSVSIGLSIIGQAGEHYQHSRRGSAPKLRIVDEKGNVLATGKFEYG